MHICVLTEDLVHACMCVCMYACVCVYVCVCVCVCVKGLVMAVHTVSLCYAPLKLSFSITVSAKFFCSHSLLPWYLNLYMSWVISKLPTISVLQSPLRPAQKDQYILLCLIYSVGK